MCLLSGNTTSVLRVGFNHPKYKAAVAHSTHDWVVFSPAHFAVIFAWGKLWLTVIPRNFRNLWETLS